MNESAVAGRDGEAAVVALLRYEGWEILERQPLAAGGHRVDLACKLEDGDEVLVEVKVWAHGGGTDSVKKAIADAYDLWTLGEPRPYILILSHHLVGLYGDMLRRAMAIGAISRVRVVGFEDLS